MKRGVYIQVYRIYEMHNATISTALITTLWPLWLWCTDPYPNSQWLIWGRQWHLLFHIYVDHMTQWSIYARNKIFVETIPDLSLVNDFYCVHSRDYFLLCWCNACKWILFSARLRKLPVQQLLVNICTVSAHMPVYPFWVGKLPLGIFLYISCQVSEMLRFAAGNLIKYFQFVLFTDIYNANNVLMMNWHQIKWMIVWLLLLSETFPRNV